MPRRFNGSIPRPQSHRFRVSVPEADESVLAWIGAQSDLSASVRSLIRDAIERHGYRDATCYPVQQQPRRGRPPKDGKGEQQRVDVDETAVPGTAETDSVVERTSDVPVLPVPPASPVQPALSTSYVSDDDDDDRDDLNDGVGDTQPESVGSIEDMLGALR